MSVEIKMYRRSGIQESATYEQDPYTEQGDLFVWVRVVRPPTPHRDTRASIGFQYTATLSGEMTMSDLVNFVEQWALRKAGELEGISDLGVYEVADWKIVPNRPEWLQ